MEDPDTCLFCHVRATRKQVIVTDIMIYRRIGPIMWCAQEEVDYVLSSTYVTECGNRREGGWCCELCTAHSNSS